MIVLKNFVLDFIKIRKINNNNHNYMNLSEDDCLSILKYYNVNTKNIAKKNICKLAEKYLANKLCRCIKKVNKKQSKSDSISICKNSVLKKKGLKGGLFSCKKKKIKNIKKLNKTIKINKSGK